MNTTDGPLLSPLALPTIPRASLSRALAALVALGGIACEPGTGGQPEELSAVSAAVACAESSGQQLWTFDFEAAGPVSDEGATAYIETEALPNPDGYAMTLVGRQGNTSVQFRTEVAGTPEGEEPSVGDVPYSCEQLDAITLQFCAVHVGTTDRPCWVCGDETMGSPPGGAVGWVSCGL